MTDILAGLLGVVLAIGGIFGYAYYQEDPTVGAVTPFTSRQLAPNPTNTYVLTTDGTNNSWAAPGAASADGTWSTTSADYWKTLRNFFSTTSADYWKTQNNFFSTTSADYWSARGLGFSTTSALNWFSGVRDWQVSNSALVPTTTRGIIVNPASSTISNLTMVNSTTTHATTTNLRIAGALNFGGVTGTAWSSFCTSITGGSGLCDGSDDGGSGSLFGQTWELVSGYLAPTTSVPIIVNHASSTITQLNLVNATTSTLVVDAGSLTRPSIAYSGNIDSGLYFTGNNPAIAVNGGTSMTWNGNNTTFTNALQSTQDGTANNPQITWNSDSNIGFYRIAEDILGFSTGGSERFRLGNSGATTTGGLAVTNLVSCDTIDTDGSGNFKCGTDATGSGGASFGQAWEISGGALAPTTTLGIRVTASSTIGSGAANGGLTISGGATTTGFAYFANTVAIGTTTPIANTAFVVGTSSWAGIHVNSNTGKIGFGCINTSPAKAVFDCGTNINVNPNIKFLVQDASDARMGVSAADQGVFMKSSGGVYAYDYALGSPRTLTLQEFGGTLDISTPTVKQHTYSSFSYSTSTAWTGTTTIDLGPAYTAESWSGVKCFTNTGTVNVSFYDGTNRMNLFNASTTVGSVTLSTNNTFTASEKRYVDIGTPASSPTKVSCTVDKIVNN